MKRLWLALPLTFVSLLIFAHPCRADIDQRCLSLCVSNGSPSSNCVTECSYNVTSKTPTIPDTGAPESHKVLKAPIPSDQLLLDTPQKAKPAGPGKDYACVNQCLQNGMRYQFCEQHCNKTPCVVGSSACKDLTQTPAGMYAVSPGAASR